MIEYIEIKVGANKTLVLEDGILKEKDMTIRDRRQSIVSDIAAVALTFALFGAKTALLIGGNCIVSKIVKHIV